MRRTTKPHGCFVQGIVCKSDSSTSRPTVFFCGNEIDEEEKKKISRVVCRASTLDIQKTLLGILVMRLGAVTGLR